MPNRQEPRYNTADAISVYVGDTQYFVFLADEIVVQDVVGKNGKVQRRRVSSRRIETSAILKASDKAHAAMPSDDHLRAALGPCGK